MRACIKDKEGKDERKEGGRGGGGEVNVEVHIATPLRRWFCELGAVRRLRPLNAAPGARRAGPNPQSQHHKGGGTESPTVPSSVCHPAPSGREEMRIKAKKELEEWGERRRRQRGANEGSQEPKLTMSVIMQSRASFSNGESGGS